MGTWKMKTFIIFCVLFENVFGDKYFNVTLTPAQAQLYEFKQEHPKPIGLLTTTSGEPVEVRDTLLLNSEHLSTQYNVDLHASLVGERRPERIVHAKGNGALGYFEVTNDISQYTYADVFNGIGKKTPVLARFSTVIESVGGSDVTRESKGMVIKFYTEQGNLDLLCLGAPVYFYKDPVHFPNLVHAFKRNPRTGLKDSTTLWDFLTKVPEAIHNVLWIRSDFGSPNGYRRMNSFAIHTYEINNKKGEKHYVKFNFRTEQGIDNLTDAQVAQIQGTDLDYYVRDLYNAIGRKEFPAWRLEMDIMTEEDIKKIDYDPFDVTKMWRNGTYQTFTIGRLVLNKNPENMYRDVELAAFNPGNLVPGIPGPVDAMFKSRRVFYREAFNYRLGTNHNNINTNKPLYDKSYVRDGIPPVRDNMKDVPNYYPNSFNGPIPFVDENKSDRKLLILQRNAVDLGDSAEFYNNVLQNDAQRQRLVDSLVATLIPVRQPVLERAIKLLYLIDYDLGKRAEVGVKAGLLAASANSN